MKRTYLPYSLVASLLLSVLLIFSSSSFAQVNILGMDATGTAEVGGRIFGGQTGSSKYEEYREFRELLWDRFYLDLENKGVTHSFELRLVDPLEEDKNLALRWQRYGKLYLGLEWDQIPHVYSNTARTLFVRTGRTSLEVDDAIQASLQADPSNANLLAQLTKVHRVALENRQDTGTLGARYTPSPDWDFRFAYSLERQNGTIPFGVYSQFREVAAPVDWKTQAVNLSAERVGKNWSLKFDYDGSFFKNGVGKLVVDNLFRVTDAFLASKQARFDLYPDNSAHTFSFSGAWNLPLRSRVTGTVSYGLMLQDDNFLPRTINTALVCAVNPCNSVASLPATSLDGKLRTLMVNLVGTTRPWNPISFTAHFRVYDLNNDGRSLTLQPVRIDLLPYIDPIVAGVPVLRRNLPNEFSKLNAGVEGTWQIIKPLNFKLGWDWESWHREFREVSRTNENAVVSALTYVPRDWVNFRLSYRQAWRRWNRYNPDIVEESFPVGNPIVNEVFEDFRKFDMANFNLGKVELMSQVNLTDKLTLSPVFNFMRHSYPSSEYGVLWHQVYGYGINFTYALSPRVSFYGDFTREEDSWKQKSRERVPTAVPGPFNDVSSDNPLDDWWTNRRGVTYTFGFGADAVIIPNKLIFDLSYASSWEKSVLSNGSVPGGTAGTIEATAPFPSIIYRFHQVLATLKYQLTKRMTAKAQYRYERFEPQDFARDVVDLNLFPLVPAGQQDVYLGAKATAYEAHIGAFALVLKF